MILKMKRLLSLFSHKIVPHSCYLILRLIDRRSPKKATFTDTMSGKWKKNKDVFEKFVHDCISDKYGSEVDRILELSTNEDCKKFLMAVGRKIWESDFELYSRFIGDKVRFKDPSETLSNIIAGRGGTCTEKCSAMKLISDAYGFKAEYLLGGANAKGPFPEDALRRMLEEMDFTLGKKYMLYWQHMALLYDLDGEDVMLDVTNGNVPFLFLTGR